MIKLSNAEIQFLKGFNPIELEKYLIQFPQRKETTEKFKRQYKWIAGQWRKR